MLEQVVDGYRQIMVRVHQALRRDDAMAVVIRIVGKRQIEFVAQRQQAGHRRLGRTVHADDAVVVRA